MKQIVRIILASTLLIGASAPMIFYNDTNVQVYTGDTFYIPAGCRNLGLLGCTPHPAHYLKEHGNDAQLLETITLSTFLDVDYVRDSFDRTFALCNVHQIDHLLIAYLPIYYIGLKQQLGDQFMSGCRHFFSRIVPEITSLITKSAVAVGYHGGVTLIIPPDYQLALVPQQLADTAERMRYLIKQFPKLNNISQSELQTITIINNKNSDEDDMLVNYFKYEYLYEKPVEYKKCDTGKERFHTDRRK